MKMNPNFLFVFVPWSLVWNGTYPMPNDLSQIRVKIGDASCKSGKEFQVEVVTSDASRSKGLGGRKEPLNSDQGMLFVFKPVRPVTMWMKDTLIPLSVGFFDSKGKLVKAHEMGVEPDPNQPAQLYSSEQNVALALELAPSAFGDAKQLKSRFICIESAKKNEKQKR